MAMKKDTKNPKIAPQKEAPQNEDSITKKNDELQEDELNKVTGGMRKSGGRDTTGVFF
jgi:bacteriocin-like protein